jgi:hypothetical protein
MQNFINFVNKEYALHFLCSPEALQQKLALKLALNDKYELEFTAKLLEND